ncbi:MAG: hypothetical protein ACI8S6_001779 [Myxococcota bacterium]|jgi:hypothetical protein
MSEKKEDLPEAPGGLLGLILGPLQAALAAGFALFAALVAGILGAFLPKPPDDEPPPQD